MKIKMTPTRKTLSHLAIALTLALSALCFANPGAAFQAPAGQEAGPANGHRRGMQGPERQLARLTRQLNLTQDQRDKIKPVLQDQHKQMMALRQDTSLSREQRRAKFMELRKSTRQQIQANLTPDQVTKFQQMEQRREQRMKAWQQKHGAGDAGSTPQNQ
ncbi:MAG: Spy/CpxP family protein refolding chaperone [Terriglobia bacterium]